MKTDDTNKCIVCFIYFILEDVRQNTVLFDPQEATLWLLFVDTFFCFSGFPIVKTRFKKIAVTLPATIPLFERILTVSGM
jgi:peptidoglycan/LPS O-acetylase OafA/YrhL